MMKNFTTTLFILTAISPSIFLGITSNPASVLKLSEPTKIEQLQLIASKNAKAITPPVDKITKTGSSNA